MCSVLRARRSYAQKTGCFQGIFIAWDMDRRKHSTTRERKRRQIGRVGAGLSGPCFYAIEEASRGGLPCFGVAIGRIWRVPPRASCGRWPVSRRPGPDAGRRVLRHWGRLPAGESFRSEGRPLAVGFPARRGGTLPDVPLAGLNGFGERFDRVTGERARALGTGRSSRHQSVDCLGHGPVWNEQIPRRSRVHSMALKPWMN